MDVFGLAVTAGGDFLRAAAIEAAHDLGVFAALGANGAGGAGLGVDAIADRIGLGGGRRRLRPLLDVLAAIGVLARRDDDSGERFVLAGAVPARGEVARAGWGLLADVVRADRPQPQETSADGLGRYHRHLVEAGAEAAAEVATLLAEVAGGGELIDLGGGAGAYSAAWLARDAAARATIVDDAAVLELARANLDGRGLGARVRLIAGDARVADAGAVGAVALLANLVHLHPSPVCAALIAAAARAVGAGGVVAIKDLRLDDDRRGSNEGLWFALNMAIYTDGGDVHTTSTLRRWLVDAGLVDVEEHRLRSAPDAIVVLARKQRIADTSSTNGDGDGGGEGDASTKVKAMAGAGGVSGLRPLVPAPAALDARRARAEADGFLYLPRLLPPARLAPLQAVLDDALTRRGWLVDGASDPALRLGGWDDPRWVDLLAEILPSPPCRDLAAAPELLDALRAVVGDDPLRHVGDVCRVVSPGAHDLATPAHQDAAYLRDPDGVWTAWIALGPCPRALGPLTLLPGSHREGILPHAAVVAGSTAVGTTIADDAPWHGGDLDAGDVLLFSAHTVHRALPNLTAATLRVSIDYRYRSRR